MQEKKNLIDNIFIGAPCNVEWQEMKGDKKRRKCLGCDKNVYNLSELNRDEAEKLLQENGDRVCLLLERDQEGKPVLSSKRESYDPAGILKGVAASLLGLLVSISSVFAKEPTKDSNSKTKSLPEKNKILTKPRKARLKVENMIALPGEVCVPVNHVNTTKKSGSGADTKYNLNPSWISDKKSREITKDWSTQKSKTGPGNKRRIGSDRRAFILYRLAKHHEKEGRSNIAYSVYKKTLQLLTNGKHDPKFKSTVEADFKKLQKSMAKKKSDKKS